MSHEIDNVSADSTQVILRVRNAIESTKKLVEVSRNVIDESWIVVTASRNLADDAAKTPSTGRGQPPIGRNP